MATKRQKRHAARMLRAQTARMLADRRALAGPAAADRDAPAQGADAGLFSDLAVAEVKRRLQIRQAPAQNPFVAPAFPPGLGHDNGPAMALDEDASANLGWAEGAYRTAAAGLAASEGIAFLGYPVLAALAQRGEYRRIVEVIATEMTRKWIRLVNRTGDEATEKRIGLVWDALERLNVRDAFRKAIEHDGFFGRGHLYICLEGDEAEGERKTSIGDGYNAASRAKVRKGSLKAVRAVEPMWAAPNPLSYNARDPLQADYYRPTAWNVMGHQIHESRLLTFVGREVPDVLKPAYGFGGLSLTQMAKPYVDNWLRTRQSVSDLLASFSVSGVKNMKIRQALANGTLLDLLNRIDVFTALRDSRGFMALDEGEEFFNVVTPLGTLDKLQAQSQEQISSITAIPLVKHLGVTPSGLNASSDGEVRVFYDSISAGQEKQAAPNLKRVIAFVQLSEFGDIDPNLGFEFEPLWQMSEGEKAEVGLKRTQAVMTAEPALPAPVVLRELREMSDATGLFTQVTDDDIADAEGAPPAPAVIPGTEAGGGTPAPDASSAAETVRALLRGFGGDAAPRSLYVSRRLLNAEQVQAWAFEQGFIDVVPAEELHVTVCYSRRAVDWMAIGEGWSGATLTVEAGGPRVVEVFGDAIVLSFASEALAMRHEQMRERGVSHDFPGYQPHVTFSHTEFGLPDLAGVTAYQGPLVFGPEIFAETGEPALPGALAA